MEGRRLALCVADSITAINDANHQPTNKDNKGRPFGRSCRTTGCSCRNDQPGVFIVHQYSGEP